MRQVVTRNQDGSAVVAIIEDGLNSNCAPFCATINVPADAEHDGTDEGISLAAENIMCARLMLSPDPLYSGFDTYERL